MGYKLRADSTLAKLNQDQLDQLFDWCSEHGFAEVQELAAKPAPEGFGMRLHKTTLARFFRDETKRRHAEELSQLAAGGADFYSQVATQNSELANLIAAARGEFAHAVYELSQAAAEPENFDRLERVLHHIDLVAIKRDQIEIQKQKLQLEEKRLELNRENFEYNGARVAMQHIVQLRALDKRTDIDQDDKIKLARQICFGSAPVSTGTAGVPPAQKSDTLKHTPGGPPSRDCGISPQQASVLETAAPRPDTLKHTTPERSVQTPEILATQNSQLTTEGPDTLKHATPERSEVPRLPDTVKTSGTLGHTSGSTASYSLSSNPNVQAPASASSTVQTPDTIKHNIAEDSEKPVPSVQSVLNKSVSGGSEETQSPVLETATDPVPLINPGKMPYSHWIKKASNPEAIDKLIFIHFSKGRAPYHQGLKANDYPVWTDNPEILRLLAA